MASPSTTTRSSMQESMEEQEFEEYGWEEGGAESWSESVDEAAESVLTVYDTDEFTSGAVVSPESTIPVHTFEFEHSFGYDCRKCYNVCACDDAVVAWSAGSMLAFLDVRSGQRWFRRSTTGGTVGHITSYRKDPNYRIAVAEAGEGYREPLILLYLWPQMTIDAVLRDGTANAYSILDFSPDGELLASVGREPDYNITIWKWQKHRILLRTSAFTFDVYNVVFSPYVPGHLTTAGAAHIKFWKMAATFTGLKLEGDLGRFGKTEICDVLGVFPMPDEKVLSGCEWGNILVWEAGLVKVEVTQKGRKRCHDAPIVQFLRNQDGYEVTSIARDGCIRTWYWDTVEQADPSEEDPFVELNPVAETCIPGAAIMSIRQQEGFNWYAQDGNGGIWIADMELDKLECEHRKVLSSHGGGVVALVSMRGHPLLLSCGEDGVLQVYHVDDKELILRYCFQTAITAVLYLPLELDSTSQTIIIGFADGVIRTVFVDGNSLAHKPPGLVEVHVDSELTVSSLDVDTPVYVKLTSILKPHSAAITMLTLNQQLTLLVTLSEDTTLFMYRVDSASVPFRLVRLGFIPTPNNIVYATWKPNEERVLLLCGQVGLLMEVVLPEAEERPYEEITTFKLDFESHKEFLLRKFYLRNKPFPEEEDLASFDEEALKRKDEPDSDDEDEPWVGEIELVLSESQLGTRVTWARYEADGTVWCVQEGTGALLRVRPGGKDVLQYGPIPGAWCDHITCVWFVCEDKYFIVGTNNGYIRMLRALTAEEDNPAVYAARNELAFEKLMKKLKGRRLAKPEPDPIPRLDFKDTYYLPMHDRYTGAITSIVFSSDGGRMFTSGRDGNIFSYAVNFTESLFPPPPLQGSSRSTLLIPHHVHDPSSADEPLMSHEQLKQKEEYDKMMAIANAHKKAVRDQLAALTNQYIKLVRANRQLPFSQQLDLTLDQRPLDDLESEIDDARALVRRQWAHQLEASELLLEKMHRRNIISLDVFPFTLLGINERAVIKTIRQKNLSSDFYDQLDEVHRKMAEAALKQVDVNLFEDVSRPERSGSVMRHTFSKRVAWGGPKAASFLLTLPPNPPHQLKKAVVDYYKRLTRHYEQQVEWQEHLSLKPDPNAMPPGAAEAIRQAEASIGNYVLKADPDYLAPPGHNTQLRLCLVRQEIYDLKAAFNKKVVDWRQEKVRVIERIQEIVSKLTEIRTEIPPALAKPLPPVPTIDEEREFPEKHLEIRLESALANSSPTMSKSKGLLQRRKTNITLARVRPARVPKFVELIDKRPLLATWELLKGKDEPLTKMEKEIKERRIGRRLYEQDMLLSEAALLIENFDKRLRDLNRERIRIMEKNALLELHLYQLHREMIVLNRFESHEDSLSEKVYTKLMEMTEVDIQIEACQHAIQERQTEIERLWTAVTDVQRDFNHLVQDHKFFDFLRRIFKKKYRPPREKDPDESSESESSSSSSSEDEEEESLDSRDIGPIRLDPNVCPEGCEQEVYDQTYALRTLRHQHEEQIKEEEKAIEALKRDIEGHEKVSKKLQTQLDKRRHNLKEFMTEKQSRLNEVDVLVLLRYDQMRADAMEDCEEPDGLRNALVFPETTLRRLRRRVLELRREIEEQKARHKTNRTHLFRMEVDIRFMKEQEEELRQRMRVAITRKLGKVRNVEKILDALLKQMARRFKIQVADAVNEDMYKQIRHWRERYAELEQKYLQTVIAYSERLRLATILKMETGPVKESHVADKVFGGYKHDQYERDVVRLKIVRKRQLKYIEVLRKEITALKMKPQPGPAPPFLPSKPPPPDRGSQLSLYRFPPVKHRSARQYFSLPSDRELRQSSSVALMEGSKKVVKLLWSCGDAFGLQHHACIKLITDIVEQVPAVVAGEITRCQLTKKILRLYKQESAEGMGDECITINKKASEALDKLVDFILEQQLNVEEGGGGGKTVRDLLSEASLSAVRNVLETMSSSSDLGMAVKGSIEAVLRTMTAEDIESQNVELLTSLICSLFDREGSLPSEEEIRSIDVDQIVGDIKAGSQSKQAIENLVKNLVEDLYTVAEPADDATIQQVDEELGEHLKTESMMGEHIKTESTLGEHPKTESMLSEQSVRTREQKTESMMGEHPKTESVLSEQSRIKPSEEEELNPFIA